MKVQFKIEPKMQYEVLSINHGLCELTDKYCTVTELNSGLVVNSDFLEQAKGDLPDYIDVVIKLNSL